jgi:hypothetical protein
VLSPNWSAIEQDYGELELEGAGTWAWLASREISPGWPWAGIAAGVWPDPITPRGNHPLSEPEIPLRWWTRFVAWLTRGFSFLRDVPVLPGSEAPPAAPRPVPSRPWQDEAKRLVRCLAWLARRNLRYLAPLFGPFWDDRPYVSFARASGRVTGRALSVSLFVHSTRRAASAAVRPAAPWEERPRTWLLGDIISRHIDVHWLLSLFAAEVAGGGQGVLGGQGGLRDPTFLALHAGLEEVSAPGQPTAHALQLVERLAQHSPLTLGVYADLFGINRAVAPDWTAVICLGPSEEGWHELWLAHLARAIVSALLAPLRSLIRLRARTSEVEALLQLQPDRPPELERELQRLDAQYKDDCTSRLVFVRGLLTAPSWAQQHESGFAYLHFLVLDMLVRALVADSVQALRKDFAHAVAQGDSTRADRILCSPNGACIRATGWTSH